MPNRAAARSLRSTVGAGEKGSIGLERLSRFVELRLTLGVHLGEMEVELVDDVGQDATDQCPSGVLVIGWYDIPGSPPS